MVPQRAGFQVNKVQETKDPRREVKMASDLATFFLG